MKIDQLMWTAADFECMNVLINDNDNDNDNVNVNDNDHVTDKLFLNKPFAIGYNLVKNLEYENLNLEKDGYIKYFGEDCVDKFTKEMLERESYLKNYFINELEINLDTISENYDQSTCWLCEKQFKPKDVKQKPVVKDHCQLTASLEA